MKIIVIGASGLIGSAVVKELRKFDQEVILASKSKGDIKVDLSDHASIEEMYQKVGPLDAVVSIPGSNVVMESVPNLKKSDFEKSLQIKCLGQIDLVLTGQKYLNDGGSFTLTTGILSHDFIPKACTSAVINNAVEGFVKSASLDLPKNLRLNVVSPNVICEAMDRYGDYFKGYIGVPVKDAALAYVRSVKGIISGQILKVW